MSVTAMEPHALKIHLLTTHLPPELDGTADHTWGTAQGLMTRGCEVGIIHPRGNEHWPLEGANFMPAFERDNHPTLLEIPPFIAAESPEWLLVQFYPLSYGGSEIGERNLLRMFSAARRSSPNTKIGLIIHERTPQVLRSSNPFRRFWIQKRMEAAIRASDVTFFLIEPWTLEFSKRFPRKQFRTLHLGSMFPAPDLSRDEMRARLGIDSDTLVLGLFGRAEPTRNLSLLMNALAQLREAGQKFLVLHMGRDDGKTAQALAGCPVLSVGPVTHQEVTRHAMAMDIYLAPYEDGVSTRRTSMMMALALGLPVIGTKGSATPQSLLDTDGRGMLLVELGDSEAMAKQVMRLAADDHMRQELGREGKALFNRELTYEKAAEKLIAYLAELSSPKV